MVARLDLMSGISISVVLAFLLTDSFAFCVLCFMVSLDFLSSLKRQSRRAKHQ